MKPIAVLGIDLAGSPRRATGICRLDGLRAKTQEAYADAEIIASLAEDLRVVAIDAPLSLPRGRCCLRSECRCSGRAHFRECDRELWSLGIRFFPLTIGPMRMLTERGILLQKVLRRKGFDVIEAFPGGSQDIWGMPRQKNPAGLRRALKEFGVKGDINKQNLSRHELDAITCALTARVFVQGRFLATGEPEEGQIILPLPRRKRRANPPSRK